ncbi:hypothetical protein [Actinophytocola algeriensis]|uniref:NAD(P)-dependent dehydrogenase (Short-subunit alcohol dehydrogenase family) n=1 Tax=Actinophytocola algeriensis TaxID=1768010 RepID=A0A7W7QDA2_9PSEU|nr:NAD(P)-dependent dehydrogenase (short-subunit alcohol dehydrogenase family) [Actinophytocola algeriensis]MBE1473490.1 NAD(P)-dependent dehydrogenase (short-subunit alcohol dehydrogenase family) [Actinophytocola algeriensis]
MLFAVEATRRWARDGITANALMPGAIYTNLQRHTSGRGSGKVPPELIRTPEHRSTWPPVSRRGHRSARGFT